MRRNLISEAVLAIVLYVPVISWFLLGFNGKLPEPAVFLTAMAILFGVYYFRKKKLLDNLQCADCQVKKNLEKQLGELEGYTRSYFYTSVVAVPSFLLLFLFLLYWKLPAANFFLLSTSGSSCRAGDYTLADCFFGLYPSCILRQSLVDPENVWRTYQETQIGTAGNDARVNRLAPSCFFSYFHLMVPAARKSTLLVHCFGFIALFTGLHAQTADEKAIRKVLDDQTTAWNRGSLDDFMHGYWNNDSLVFISSTGITYGYQNALDHYHKSYGDITKMGRLFFTLYQVKPIGTNYYYVTGRYFLKRTVGDKQGFYTLLFKKIRGQWLIISDHTS